jgi:hypothetical protein
MTRISRSNLEAVVKRLNIMTGNSIDPYTKDKNGNFIANIGNYHLSGAYGGVSLHRMSTDGGGVSDVFRCGHVTKRDLYDRLHAYLNGIERGVELSTKEKE